MPDNWIDHLDWNAKPTPAVLWVELPYWLMVRDCSVTIEVRRHQFRIDICSSFQELFAGEVLDSRRSAIYIGSQPEDGLDPGLAGEIAEGEIPTLARPCKTVLRVYSTCNPDALQVKPEDPIARKNAARYYLNALCSAHLEVINELVNRYRRATYDFFPHDLSPWQVPIWRVDSPDGFTRVTLQPYAQWDHKPLIGPSDGDLLEYELISPSGLQQALMDRTEPSELELLDALNRVEIGDYAGAVRRITTAIEALLERVLRKQLEQRYPESDVDGRLEASKNDFPGRFRQYIKLSGRAPAQELQNDLEATRALRHQIVHNGLRIPYFERGRAQRCVDTGRWLYNWLESDPERARVRERNMAARSIGRNLSVFDAEILPEGVVVSRPSL